MWEWLARSQRTLMAIGEFMCFELSESIGPTYVAAHQLQGVMSRFG